MPGRRPAIADEPHRNHHALPGRRALGAVSSPQTTLPTCAEASGGRARACSTAFLSPGLRNQPSRTRRPVTPGRTHRSAAWLITEPKHHQRNIAGREATHGKPNTACQIDQLCVQPCETAQSTGQRPDQSPPSRARKLRPRSLKGFPGGSPFSAGLNSQLRLATKHGQDLPANTRRSPLSAACDA